MNANNLSTKSAGAGLLVAITASLCCITPVLALISGVSGMAASFLWLEPLRPFMIGLTVAVLGFAWHQKLKPKSAEVDCACESGEEEKTSFMQTKTFLGLVTVLAGLMVAFPNYSYAFYPEATNNTVTTEPFEVRQVDLKVAKMTCTGCEAPINHEVSKLAGVSEVKASYKNGNTVVKFDPKKTTKAKIIEAINKTGYKVKEANNSTGN